MSRWLTVYKTAWTVLVILCAIGLVGLFLPQYNRLRKMQREKVERQQENREIEARIRQLRDKQKRFKEDPAFVERTARETGMVKPHEKVMKLTNSTSRARSPLPLED